MKKLVFINLASALTLLACGQGEVSEESMMAPSDDTPQKIKTLEVVEFSVDEDIVTDGERATFRLELTGENPSLESIRAELFDDKERSYGDFTNTSPGVFVLRLDWNDFLSRQALSDKAHDTRKLYAKIGDGKEFSAATQTIEVTLTCGKTDTCAGMCGPFLLCDAERAVAIRSFSVDKNAVSPGQQLNFAATVGKGQNSTGIVDVFVLDTALAMSQGWVMEASEGSEEYALALSWAQLVASRPHTGQNTIEARDYELVVQLEDDTELRATLDPVELANCSENSVRCNATTCTDSEVSYSYNTMRTITAADPGEDLYLNVPSSCAAFEDVTLSIVASSPDYAYVDFDLYDPSGNWVLGQTIAPSSEPTTYTWTVDTNASPAGNWNLKALFYCCSSDTFYLNSWSIGGSGGYLP